MAGQAAYADAQKGETKLSLDHVSPATRLLEKRRQMFEVQEALDKQQEEFARREEAFRHREEALRKKDLDLQESLIKFNKFLQENEAKRNRADKRYEEECKQRKQKEETIKKLMEGLEQDKKKNKELQATVDRSMKYQSYLEKVAEYASEDYGEISDVIGRYRTLRGAHDDLRHQSYAKEEANEIERAEYNQMTKLRTNEILNFNNEIAKLQKRLEKYETTRIRLQSEVDTAVRATSDKTLTLGQIFMAVNNLVQRCTSKRHGRGIIIKHKNNENIKARRNHGSKNKEDDEEEGKKKKGGQLTNQELENRGKQTMTDLHVILKYLVDFNSIVKECPKEARRWKKGGDYVANASAQAPKEHKERRKRGGDEAGNGSTSSRININGRSGSRTGVS